MVVGGSSLQVGIFLQTRQIMNGTPNMVMSHTSLPWYAGRWYPLILLSSSFVSSSAGQSRVMMGCQKISMYEAASFLVIQEDMNLLKVIASLTNAQRKSIYHRYLPAEQDTVTTQCSVARPQVVRAPTHLTRLDPCRVPHPQNFLQTEAHCLVITNLFI